MKKLVKIIGLITMVILANACSEDDRVEFVAAKGKLQKLAHYFPQDLEHPYSAYEYKYDAAGR